MLRVYKKAKEYCSMVVGNNATLLSLEDIIGPFHDKAVISINEEYNAATLLEIASKPLVDTPILLLLVQIPSKESSRHRRQAWIWFASGVTWYSDKHTVINSMFHYSNFLVHSCARKSA